MIAECLVALVSGAAIESASVAWVHFSERGEAGKTAVFSMAMAAAQVCGIGESIRDWRVGAFFVLGYGLGTWAAVRFKSRKPRTVGAAEFGYRESPRDVPKIEPARRPWWRLS